MSRRSNELGVLALIVVLGVSSACAREQPQTLRLQVGRHRLRLVSPRGWEHLDHGRQQLFRNGESELLLEDLGPVTPKGLVGEIREAEQLWRAGRREDALARMSALDGPPVSFLPQQVRADFWKSWTDVSYVPGAANDAAVGQAFQAMISAAEALPPPPVENIVEYALRQSEDADRREVDRRESKWVHGSEWVTIETWTRVSHMYRRRLAFVDDAGYLLYLSTERGLIEQSGGAFDSLLASIEMLQTP